MTKWGARPHWEYDAVYLGGDEHGEWLGCPVGTHFARPGMEFTADFDSVVLVPADAAAHVAAFNAPPRPTRIYVDMTTPAVWHGASVHCIDLDLDVIARTDGEIFLDDEDEFIEHQTAFGYPPEIVTMTEQSATSVLKAVQEGVAPFDGATAERWLAELARRSAAR